MKMTMTVTMTIMMTMTVTMTMRMTVTMTVTVTVTILMTMTMTMLMTMLITMTLLMTLSAPVLDDCLQHGSTPVLGPVWVTKGERFSPTGVREFLIGLIAYAKSKLKEAKRYQKQVTALLLLLAFSYA